MLRWAPTTIAGVEHYCAKLPDGRWAYVEPRGEQWRLRVVRKPGQPIADFYLMRPSARAAKKWAEARYGKDGAKAERKAVAA
jgi:hypothetical protein